MAEAAVSVALATFRDLLLEKGRFLGGVSSEVRALEPTSKRSNLSSEMLKQKDTTATPSAAGSKISETFHTELKMPLNYTPPFMAVPGEDVVVAADAASNSCSADVLAS